MKNGPKLSLALIGIFLILCEFFYGIPFLGATFILSFVKKFFNTVTYDYFYCIKFIQTPFNKAIKTYATITSGTIYANISPCTIL